MANDTGSLPVKIFTLLLSDSSIKLTNHNIDGELENYIACVEFTATNNTKVWVSDADRAAYYQNDYTNTPQIISNPVSVKDTSLNGTPCTLLTYRIKVTQLYEYPVFVKRVFLDTDTIAKHFPAYDTDFNIYMKRLPVRMETAFYVPPDEEPRKAVYIFKKSLVISDNDMNGCSYKGYKMLPYSLETLSEAESDFRVQKFKD